MITTRATKKRKFNTPDKILDLMTIAKGNPDFHEVLKSTLSLNPHPLMVTILKSIQEELYGLENVMPTLNIQANKLKFGDVQRYLCVDYLYGDSRYRWSMKDGADPPKPLFGWAGVSGKQRQLRPSGRSKSDQPAPDPALWDEE